MSENDMMEYLSNTFNNIKNHTIGPNKYKCCYCDKDIIDASANLIYDPNDFNIDMFHLRLVCNKCIEEIKNERK